MGLYVLFGAPGEIRTHDLWLRRPTLYPTELRAHITKVQNLKRKVKSCVFNFLLNTAVLGALSQKIINKFRVPLSGFYVHMKLLRLTGMDLLASNMGEKLI